MNTTTASSKATARKSRRPDRRKTKFFSPVKPALRVAVALPAKNFSRAILPVSAAALVPASSGLSAAAEAAEIVGAAVIAADAPTAVAVDAAVSIVAAVPDTAVAAMDITAASVAIAATAARSAALN